MSDQWQADIYTTFLDARTKPAKDLLFGIPDFFNPHTVYDLGCGPGNSTILLKERWQKAIVIGTDSSKDMLQKATITYPDLLFIEEKIEHFNPSGKVDCIFSNAALQWVSEHDVLIPRLLHYIKPDGFLAIQMPNNWHCASHQITINILEHNDRWQHLLEKLRYHHLIKPFYNPEWYYELLTHAGANFIQIWQTEYFQELANHQAIFDWVKGTALRPILSEMDTANQKEFEQCYISMIKDFYPIQKNARVLLPYQRLFMIASRG